MFHKFAAATLHNLIHKQTAGCFFIARTKTNFIMYKTIIFNGIECYEWNYKSMTLRAEKEYVELWGFELYENIADDFVFTDQAGAYEVEFNDDFDPYEGYTIEDDARDRQITVEECQDYYDSGLTWAEWQTKKYGRKMLF